MAAQLPFCKDIINCVLKGYTPVSLSGVSNIHKAHTVLGLSRISPVLVICDDEAHALRMAQDINEMSGQQLAVFYPAKDLNFALMEGISREYEHKRIEALSQLMQGKAKR